MPEIDTVLSDVCAKVAQPYGMTGDQLLAYLLIGDRRHADAPERECGAVDPRDAAEQKWCRRPAGHEGHHNCYRMDEDWSDAAGGETP